MEFHEPRRLPEIGRLAGRLEEQPLLGVPGLGRSRGKADLVVLVVGGDEVLENGAGFPEGEACVGVLDGGDPAVGVDGGVGGLLDVVPGDRDDFVREAELVEDYLDFRWVGPSLAIELDGFEIGVGAHGG